MVLLEFKELWIGPSAEEGKVLGRGLVPLDCLWWNLRKEIEIKGGIV